MPLPLPLPLLGFASGAGAGKQGRCALTFVQAGQAGTGLPDVRTQRPQFVLDVIDALRLPPTANVQASASTMHMSARVRARVRGCARACQTACRHRYTVAHHCSPPL